MFNEPQIGHILRKYNPAEWAGTETAVADLILQLKPNYDSKIYCPRLEIDQKEGPFEELGISVDPFNAFLPIIGLDADRREQLTQIGGNLMSFDLMKKLWQQKNLSIIHMHTLGLLGGIGRTIAKRKGIPLVVSLHGGVIDIPKDFINEYKKKVKGSLSYARIFSTFLKSNKVLEEADAIITFNKREQALLLEKYPHQKIVHIPHGIETEIYRKDYRELAYEKYPWLKEKTFCLVVGRIDSVKNQGWLMERLPALLEKIPNLVVGLLGPVTDFHYNISLKKKIIDMGLSEKVYFLGALPPKDPLLIGLYQIAAFTALPSFAEPFGLVILESWASNTPVLASAVSGPIDIIQNRETGWLFDLGNPKTFHDAVLEVVGNPQLKRKIVEQSQNVLDSHYDLKIMGERTRRVYTEVSAKLNM